MIHQMTDWLMTLIRENGASSVFVAVIIESIIVPIPSPLIIMGAGVLLVNPLFGWADALWPITSQIVLPGAVASTLGGLMTYAIGFWGGKPVIDRFKNFLGFNWDDVMGMERRLSRRVGPAILGLRALPIVPLSLISVAAGAIRVPVGPFLFWTLLGSIPRCFILAYLGHFTRGTYERLAGGLNTLESAISGLIVIATIALVLWMRQRMARSA